MLLFSYRYIYTYNTTLPPPPHPQRGRVGGVDAERQESQGWKRGGRVGGVKARGRSRRVESEGAESEEESVAVGAKSEG
jgi:hypothetical protein